MSPTGLFRDADTDYLTVLNGYIRNCAQAVQARHAGNRFKDLWDHGLLQGIIVSRKLGRGRGRIFGQNSTADLSLITVGEGSRVSECLMGINSGSTALEGIECGEGSEVRRILFYANSLQGTPSYLVRGADLVEQVLAHDNTFPETGHRQCHDDSGLRHYRNGGAG